MRERSVGPAREGVDARERRAASGWSLIPHRNALLLEQPLQLTGLEHLPHDIAAAQKLALHIELRDCRPLSITLDALPQVIRLEHVDALVGHPEVIENLHDLGGEPALGKLRGALH